MQHKRRIIWGLSSLLFAIFLPGMSAFSLDLADRDLQAKTILVRETAFPLVPTMSEASFQSYLRPSFGLKALSKVKFQIWYLGSSAYFVPDPFLEAGISFAYVFDVHPDFLITTGIGSALSFTNIGGGVYHIPFIADISLLYAPAANWLNAGAKLRCLVYGEGFILDPTICALFHPFKFGLVGEVSAGLNYGYSWNYKKSEAAPKISMAIGWSFR